jgi:lysophospholipase L1-like esterase
MSIFHLQLGCSPEENQTNYYTFSPRYDILYHRKKLAGCSPKEDNMSEDRRRRGKTKRDVLLPLAAVLLTAAACAAAAAAVLGFTDIGRLAGMGWRSMAPASSQAASSSPSRTVSYASQASSAASSAPASSSQAQTQGYSDFKTAVFIGDSITMGISEYSAAECLGVFASNGMNTSNALTSKVTVGSSKLALADALRQAKPQRVYIMLGSNDMAWITPSGFAVNYGSVVDSLRAAYPGAVYYAQSVLPVTAAYEKKYNVSNSKIDSMNSALSAMCSQKGIKYADVASSLKGNDGKLLTDAAAAGFNIKSAYYKKWLEALLKY